MKFTESLRNKIFWSLDKLRGQKISNQLNDIKFILDNYSSDESKQRRNKHLQKILNHSVNTTEYYSSYKNKSIKDFPVIDKNTIRENLDSILSKNYDKTKLRRVTTSGSTGTPFVVYQDGLKQLRNYADNLYYSTRTGFPFGTRLYYIRIWNNINKKSLLFRLFQNLIMEEASDLSETKTLELLRRIENDNSTKAVLAYGTTYDAIASNLQKKGLQKGNANVEVMYSMSEALSESTRKYLSDFFSCPIYSRYSNAENGFLAHQVFNDSGEYEINEASYYIELLDMEKDIPVEKGQMGRIVITDLFNFAMPFIRYDTGDIGIIKDSDKTDVPVFERIDGRRLDFVYSTNGSMISPHLIDYTVRKKIDVKQFQFVQVEKDKYIIKLNSDKLSSERENQIKNELLLHLGKGANLDLEYINEIPILKSGKRKIVVNLMNSPK